MKTGIFLGVFFFAPSRKKVPLPPPTPPTPQPPTHRWCIPRIFTIYGIYVHIQCIHTVYTAYIGGKLWVSNNKVPRTPPSVESRYRIDDKFAAFWRIWRKFADLCFPLPSFCLMLQSTSQNITKNRKMTVNVPKNELKCPKMVRKDPKWCQNATKTTPKRPHNDAKTMPKWSLSDLKMTLDRPKNGPKSPKDDHMLVPR